MYLELFGQMVDFTITENIFIDMTIVAAAAKLLHYIVFGIIGDFYRENIISGSMAGRIAYCITWLIMVIPTLLILFILKYVIKFINLIL